MDQIKRKTNQPLDLKKKQLKAQSEKPKANQNSSADPSVIPDEASTPKHEIRNAKYETNSKNQIANNQTSTKHQESNQGTNPPHPPSRKGGQNSLTPQNLEPKTPSSPPSVMLSPPRRMKHPVDSRGLDPRHGGQASPSATDQDDKRTLKSKIKNQIAKVRQVLSRVFPSDFSFFNFNFSFRRKTFRQRLSIALVTILALAASGAYLFRGSEEAAAWWNDGWQFRRKVVIDNPGSGALTDFQVSFTLDTATPIAAGKMQSACQDIRIVDQFGKLAPHWVEENNPGCDNASTRIWTKLETIPAAGISLFVYYGNAEAAGVANGDEVFVFIDDFNAGSWDTTIKWEDGDNSSAVTSQGSGILTLDSWLGSGLAGRHAEAVGRISLPGEKVVEARMRRTTGDTYGQLMVGIHARGYSVGPSRFVDTDDFVYLGWNNFANTIALHGTEAGISKTSATLYASDFPNDVWWNWKIFMTATGVDAQVFDETGTAQGSNSLSYTSTSDLTYLALLSDNQDGFVDYIFVREYAADEPVASAAQGEQVSPGPALWWRLEEGSGTTASDASGSGRNGTLTNTPVWQTEDQCVSGKCLRFTAASSQYVNYATSVAGVRSVSFWVRPTAASTNLLVLNGAAGNANLTTNAANQVVAGAGFTTPTIYVDGVETNQLQLNQWQHVTVTTESGITASNLMLGRVNTGYLSGFVDEFKLYTYTRTPAQVQADAVPGAGASGSSVIFGHEDMRFLNDGLVGHWKFDEESGNATDSSESGITLTNNGTTPFDTGRYSNAPTFNGSSRYFSAGTTIDNVRTVSFWQRTGSVAEQFIHLAEGIYINATTQDIFAPGWSNPRIYVNGLEDNSVSILYEWQHITVTTDTGITASALEIGRANGSYASNNSQIDDVRVYDRTLSPREIQQLHDWAPGPVAHWKLDENTGSAAADSSGNENTGTLQSSPAWVPGKYGAALDLDGAGQGVLVSSSSSLEFGTGNFSWAVWVKRTGACQASSSKIIEHHSATHINRMQCRSNNEIEFQAHDSNDNRYISPTFLLALDTWHHIVGVKEGNEVKLYADGEYIGSTAATFTGNFNADAFRLGYSVDGADRHFEGLIDDVQIFNHALEEKHIINVMNGRSVWATAVGSPVGSAVGHWQFEEGYGTTAHNTGSAGASLDGTLTDMASPGTATSGWTNDGPSGKALNFDGTNDYINIPHDPVLDITEDITISAWIRLASLDEYGPILAKTNGTDTWNYDFYVCGNSEHEYGCGADYSNLLVFHIESGVETRTVNSTTAITDTEWHHVLVTRNGYMVNFYIDGEPAGSDIANGAFNADAVPLRIGTDGPGWDAISIFNGGIDEVKLYNYSLTEEEVLLEYNQGKSVVLGSTGTDSSGAPSNSASRVYCVPGDTATCDPPVAEWRFDENQGDTAFDTSGNGLNLDLNNTAGYTTGKNGSALDLLVAGDYANRADNALLNPENITVSAWVRIPAGLASNWNKVVTKGNDKQYTLAVKRNSALTPDFRIWIGSTEYNAQGSTDVLDGNWHHLVGSYDGSYVRLYVDGILEAETSATGALDTDSQDFRIGRSHAGGASNFIIGAIDDIRIFDYGRTPAQVAWEFNQGAPVAHYRFEECQGTTIHDVSVHKNHGTLTVGGTGSQTASGDCSTADTAWGNGASGRLGASLNLDGTDDFVDVGDELDLSGNTPMSIGAWIYPTGTPGSQGHVISKYDDGTAGEWYLGIDGNRNVTFLRECGSYGTTGKAVMPLNTWTHILGAYDGTDLRIYVNGQLDQETTDSCSTTDTAISIVIGAEENGGGTKNYFPGQLDDVRLYNYPLTEHQIRDAMNDGAVRFE